jgi:hypothetical protein
MSTLSRPRVRLPRSKGFREGARARHPFFNGDQAPPAIGVNHGNFEPELFLEEFDIARHLGVNR